MSSLAERHQYIIKKLQKEQYVNVVDLCKELKVSSVTIRKDLKLLDDKKLLFKIHGGATLSNPYAVDRSINEKEKLQAGEKARIGQAAAALVKENDSIIIASGTSVLAFVRALPANINLTAITSALNVAMELTRHPNVEVMQLGGVMRKTSTSVMGPYSQAMLKDFYCNKLFLGVDGIDLESGLTTTNMMEAQVNRQMIGVSQKTIVLTDSTKFGKRGFGKICNIDEIDHIITDKGISDHIVKQLESMGITVTIA